MPFRSNTNNNDVGSSFEVFFEGWLVPQEHYLDELLSVQQNCDEEHYLRDLIARVLSHYQQYYEEKSRAANRNIFMVFSPTWFSSLERTFFWIGGFKPGLAFRLVSKSVGDLSEEQSRTMHELRAETKKQEREVGEKMARVQESVAAPPLLELARRMGRRVDGEIRDVDSMLAALSSSMETLLESADFLRANTVAKIIEILNPAQSVRFLITSAQLQLRIRTWGLQRDAEAPH